VSATTTWATITTDILSVEIPIIRDAMIAAAGMEPGMAIYAGGSAGAESYLLRNSEVFDYFKMTPTSLLTMQQGQLSALGGIGGIPSWARYDGGYKDTGGSFTKYITNDTIVFLPPQSEMSQVLGFAEGYVALPNSADVVGIGQVQGVKQETGISAYAVMLNDPWAVKLVLAYRFLPVIRDGNAVINFDPTP
jgi:hypothetical protein